MDRAEAAGLGVAVAGHGLLLAVLSLGFANAVQPPIVNPPMEVSLVEDAALVSSAPAPAEAEPAPKLAEVEGPVEPAPPPPLPEPAPLPQPQAIEPVPAPKPVEQPRPKAVAPAPTPKPKPAPRPIPPKAVPPKAAPAPARPAPAKAKAAPQQAPTKATAPASSAKAAARPTGRLSGILSGISERENQSRSETPPAAKASAAVQSSLGAEVRRQLKPHWKSPTGADAELLRTELSVSLAPSGAVTDVDVVRTTGQTDSNRPQVRLHQEQAIRAARLASPFRLPPEFYEAWKVIRPTFDKRLSQ